LARYKPYCIQVVSAPIEAYLNTPLSLFKIIHEKYALLPIEYRSLRLCLKKLAARAHLIYSFALRELVEINPSWNHHEDPRFLEIPSHLKKKTLRKEILELYHLFVMMEHYMAVAKAKFSQSPFPASSWLVLANHILFLNTYATIF
jgi:hypothetical protein